MKTTISLVAILLFVLQLNAQTTVSTYSPSNLTQTTVTVSGYVDPGAGTFYSVEFQISTNNAFSNIVKQGINGTSMYSTASNVSFDATGLNPNTQYFVRLSVGFSTIDGGSKDGNTVGFTTLGSTLPTVNIGSDFSSITDQSASNTSNQVVGDGGSSVTDCGLVVATHPNPSSSDTKISVTSGLVTYNGNINNLNQLTKYYVKAYALNSTGYGYSTSEKSFSTLASTNASIDSMVSHNSGELTIYFQPGSGDACIVYLKEGSTIIDNPINGSTYSGSTVFGSGDDIGDGTYVICSNSNAKGSNNDSVTITNLNDDNNYYVKAGAYDNTSKTYDITGTELSTKDNSNLPIELISFSAKKTESGINLNWVTATELNNDYFTIERSTNNSKYKEISIVNGAGNSNKIIEYEFIDNNFNENTSYYYRLKQTDFDGKFSYSNIIYITSTKENLSLINLSNSENSINLNISNPVNEGQIQLIGIDGKINSSQELPIGDNIQISFDKSSLAKGIYIIRLTNNYNEICKKVIL